MAIVTLCPQCQTGFVILPEHLSAADGWVRCGRCAHVFAVEKHLYEMDDPKPVQELVQPLSKPQPLTRHLQKNSAAPIQLHWYVMPWLLLLLLAIQWLVFQRNMLAARIPELTPALQAVCEQLDCQVSAWKDPEQVAIESSSFKRLPDGRFVFEGVVRNMGDAQLAAASLELSLTRQGEVVVRQVISPAQLGLPPTLPPRRNQSFSLNFSLDPAVSADIDGFTALLFYP